MYAPHRVVRVALVDASAAAGREVTREGTVARFLRGIRDREAQGLTYWVVDDADTLRIDLHELASAVARTVNNDPQTPEGSEPVSNAYQLSTAERAVIEAAKAYEKWMGNWHDYTVRSGDKPAKQQRALIDAVRALARAGGAKR
jgi:DNA-binding HxlR family transcriptional regulator